MRRKAAEGPIPGLYCGPTNAAAGAAREDNRGMLGKLPRLAAAVSREAPLGAAQ